MDDVTQALGNLSLGQKPVYLLKTPSSPSDAYQELLGQTDSFKPIFVPVLDHLFRDDALRTLKRHAERFAFAGGSEATARQKATNNPAKRYGGIIFTSQRAVDAFGSLVNKLSDDKLASLFDKDMPIYVVGPATSRGVRALGLPCPVSGEECGNGEALAQHIMTHHNALSPEITHLNGHKLPLLFPVGEQRRDIIPNTLQGATRSVAERIPVHEVVVYETGEMTTFEEDFTKLVRTAKAAKCSEQCVVVFSPQGCEAMLNALGWLDERSGKFDSKRRETVDGQTKTSIITIGPTTRDHLVQEFGFVPDATADSPSPDGVLAAIHNIISEA